MDYIYILILQEIPAGIQGVFSDVFCIQQEQALLGAAAENKAPADAQRFH